jgi:hypothetical protein
MYIAAVPQLPPVAPAPFGSDSSALEAPTLRAGISAAGDGAAPTVLRVRSKSLDVLAGGSATVSGTLQVRRPLDPLAGRMVALQGLARGGWRTLAAARTGRLGNFRLSFSPHATGSERVRLRFAGEQYLLEARRRLGRLNVYRQVQVSWYGGEGPLACGGQLSATTMGVASPTLPCGTLLTLRFDGRSLRVPVIDRGPYVGGRELDLTQATKVALGFGDIGTVWSTA